MRENQNKMSTVSTTPLKKDSPMIPHYCARSNLSRCQDWAPEKEIKVTQCWQEEKTFPFSPLSGRWGSSHLSSDMGTNESSNTLTSPAQGTFGLGHPYSVTGNGISCWTADDTMFTATSPMACYLDILILSVAHKDIHLKGITLVLRSLFPIFFSPSI